MKLDGFELRTYSLPYGRPVHWFNTTEAAADFVALRVFAQGARGAAESPLKPTWTGLSLRATAALIADLYLPALDGVDVTDTAAVHKTLAIFPGNQTAKMLVVNACATLAAAAEGVPLWRKLGGTGSVELSWCVTRQPPAAMAEEAEKMVSTHGFRTLKVKGGQGFDTDRAVLRAVRAAVGPGIILTVDANQAYSIDEAVDYVELLAEEGVEVAEDPCKLGADAALGRLIDAASIPILIDTPCLSVADAQALLDAGARAISIKPGRIGIVEATDIEALVRQRGAALCTGFFSESAFGSVLGLEFSAAVVDPFLPAEQSFFLLMREQVMRDIPAVADGLLRLPESADLDAMVDWSRTEKVEAA